MDLYKIKLMGFDLYIKAVVFDTSNEELKLKPIFAFMNEKPGIYEEDKAKKYCEQLNKQENEVQYILEKVG